MEKMEPTGGFDINTADLASLKQEQVRLNQLGMMKDVGVSSHADEPEIQEMIKKEKEEVEKQLAAVNKRIAELEAAEK